MALLVSSLLGGCSDDNVARVADACDLLTADEISEAIGATAQPGKLVSAIGDNEARICSFSVDGNLGTISVYLGEGVPSERQAASPSLAASASERVYVSVGAQFYDADFEPIAARLAQRALDRALRE